MDLFYDPPYYAYWVQESVDAIKAGRQWLRDLIARKGPYDAVMMFSQGCTLGLSSLLLQGAEEPHKPLPFKAAIFICGGPSFDIAQSVGYQVSEEMKERDRQSRLSLDLQADTSAILAQGAARWTGGHTGGLSEDDLRAEIQGPFKIDIPTVHIYGNKDPRYLAGVQISAFCNPEKRKAFNHEGGHEIPRRDAVSRRIAMLVEWVLEEADLI